MRDRASTANKREVLEEEEEEEEHQKEEEEEGGWEEEEGGWEEEEGGREGGEGFPSSQLTQSQESGDSSPPLLPGFCSSPMTWRDRKYVPQLDAEHSWVLQFDSDLFAQAADHHAVLSFLHTYLLTYLLILTCI